MKHFTNHICTLTSAAILTIAALFSAPQAQAQEAQEDSFEVSLLTCQPSQRIYGLYGHTALRLHDLRTGSDWSFNYGVFNFEKPFFVLRFLFGLTDYELGAVPMDIFREEYVRQGCQVTEQVINLTDAEKRRLLNALEENYRPENRTYRYNYFYDNCTTRARDMVERCISGRITYPGERHPEADGASYRQMIHEHTADHPWAAVGNDLCLGVKADQHTSWRQRQFLPEDLMHDFDKALITTPDGQQRPLVNRKHILIEGRQQVVVQEFPLTPLSCSLILIGITIAVSLIEIKHRKSLVVYDLLLMTAQGLAGVIVTAMLFSEHPTTSTNLQALVLNPLPLAFIYQVARHRSTRYWAIAASLTLLCLAGGLIQDYAEGFTIVALCLLIRQGMHLYVYPKLGLLPRQQKKNLCK